jgi:nucleoid DNA-binding protein
MAASTITKQDIVMHVSAKTGLPQHRVTEVVQHTFDCMSELLAGGRRIEIRNFGVFDVKVKKARMGRILATMQPVQIPARAVVRFKPGKEMRQIVAERATVILAAQAEAQAQAAALALNAPVPPQPTRPAPR